MGTVSSVTVSPTTYHDCDISSFCVALELSLVTLVARDDENEI